MNSKASPLLSFAFVIIFFSSASAFNITRLLGQFPEFSTFNNYLTQTQLFQPINSRNSITVLAVNNKAIAGLSGKPLDVIKKILSVHVVLDYYDVEKLTMLPKKTTVLTTLFQSSGLAVGQQGFLDVSLVNEGEVAFGSAEKGSGLNIKLVKPVVARPYNISVLEVTSPIVPPGIDQAAASPKSPPTKPVSPTASPKKSPMTAPTHAPAKEPVAKAPAPTDEVTGDSPIESPSSAPEADAPNADAPSSDDAAPVSSPVPSAADDASTPAPAESGSSRTNVASGFLSVGVVMGLVALSVSF
ncbi:hypothetical protein I3843_07G209800 [Carya illinoinensis]|uniref:FAS1 domain-containing protein n=1 Tax=Carya illinoinensis TaxID=32201 RepID=A0A8T1Q1U4_CARIL|nr:fasciclin-like arabinogalactan protein 14 [Carya illinoinensis]KAG6649465.1 hypothetical protein CIPAW_07G214200 [Carya illinoinensis]KAG6706283.1 hypothetical protein I3842_07G216500 [Carya illinoinensis]KAG7973028.1 hypothetical protein I3843_07G209800 [Carya illinoinensis]